MNEERTWAGILEAMVILVIFGTVAISATGTWAWIYGPNGVTTAAWLQAIGGIGAIVAAFFIAGYPMRKSLRDDLARAELVAAKIGPMLESPVRSIAIASLLLKDEDVHPARILAQVNRNLKDAIEVLSTISDSDLLAIVPLPRRAAHRLSRIVSLLKVLTDDLGKYELHFRNGVYPQIAFKALSTSWDFKLDGIHGMLEICWVELENAGNRCAPVASTDERDKTFDD